MPRNDRKKPLSARRARLAVDRLESREMLSAAPTSAHTIIPAQVRLDEIRVAHTAKVEAHAAKVEAIKEAHAEAKANRAIPSHRFLTLFGPSHRGTVNPLAGVGTPVSGAYNPTQVETAYGTNLLYATNISTVAGTTILNEGQGQTIAIVDELDDSSITADTNVYSSQYGLPLMDGVGSDPTLTVYKDTALGSVGTAAGTGVAVETSLDVELAHAMAPLANILLVEVPATGSNANAFAELLHGVQYAAGHGASVVSLSYGIGEASIGNSTAVTNQNNTYLATGAATNVAVTVSTGDGSKPLYPATSPNVVAVGGTSLYLSSARGRYNYETAWGGLAGAGAGGGGLSSDFGAPTFQSGNGVTFAKRAIPDVSAVADPVTSVSIYDSFDGDNWTDTGGTSVAAPVTAGVLALAQQQRAVDGKAPLTSAQIDSAMYALYNSSSYSTYFHDVTLGKNSNVNSAGNTTVAGFSATTGYDEATGIGSIIANTLDPYLASL